MTTTPHYRQSELIDLLLTSASLKDIAASLLLTENQANRAAKAIYDRAKVGSRIEFMAKEIVRLRQRKKNVAA